MAARAGVEAAPLPRSALGLRPAVVPSRPADRRTRGGRTSGRPSDRLRPGVCDPQLGIDSSVPRHTRARPGAPAELQASAPSVSWPKLRRGRCRCSVRIQSARAASIRSATASSSSPNRWPYRSGVMAAEACRRRWPSPSHACTRSSGGKQSGFRPVSRAPDNHVGADDVNVGPDMDARYGVCGRTTLKEWTRRRSGAPGGLMRASKLCTRIRRARSWIWPEVT